MNVHSNALRPRQGRRRSALIAAALGASAILFAGPTAPVTAAPPTVIDDFNDGDADDWSFFGGNGAGGGGGALGDRPVEGGFYLSTGWGGDGTASGFYGGTFRNFDDGQQVVVPADPWFNMWVLNQSDATVDQYVLEVTLREDTDGDGWTDGSDDSIGLDTTITSSSFSDRWTLLSAPLSDFFDRGTGGNGVFDGALDEIVIVFGGVQGAPASAIEVDFDQIAFTSGGPLAGPVVVFDDMEHGDPAANDWFSFPGAVGGGGLGPNDSDLPPSNGGNFSIETGWGSGGTPGFYGGFGRTSLTDLTGQQYFNFWINPNDGQEYTLEINLQEDDDGNGIGDPGADDEFQYNCVVDAAGTCAAAGGGWQLVSIPLADFFDDNSFYTGGNGVLDATPVDDGGNGELVSVVVAVIGTGTDANFRTDYWAFSIEPIVPDTTVVIDDFESGLPTGTNGDGIPVGFYTFQGAGGSIAISNPQTPPAPELPEIGTPNAVFQMDVDSTSFAGFINGFTNPAADAWMPQDWSTSEGISMWFHGNGSGADLFIDILDNRNPGSTTDDSERYTTTFVDDVAGWRLLEFPFSSFTRKEIGNGAPADGLGLFEMYGYAVGTLGTGGLQTFYIDQVSRYGVAEPPAAAMQFSRQNTFIEEGTTGSVAVKLNRPLGDDDPDQVSIDYATERSYAIAGEEYTPTNGTLTFVKGGPTELSFDIETFDDTKFEGLEQIVIRLTNPVGAERGALFQGSAMIEDDDPFDPDLLDDFEQGAFLWESDGLVEFDALRSEASETGARPGQDAVENVLAVSTPRSGEALDAAKAGIIADLEALLPDASRRSARRIQRAIEYLEFSLLAERWQSPFFLTQGIGAASMESDRLAVQQLRRVRGPEAAAAGEAIEAIVAIDAELAELALAVAESNGVDELSLRLAQLQLDRAERDLERGRAANAIQDYRLAWQFATNGLKHIDAPTLGGLEHDFPLGRDWTGTQSIDFWFEGTGSGEDITITLQDNRAPDPGPAGWQMVWSDEFDEAAGTPPNPANWSYELGDTTPDGKNGWGNEELQYYTDDPDNAATDGEGNLVITLDAADGSQECYYGPCEFESARLITQHKAEFAYGRIESRLKVPDGGDGLWPAFWSLGTDIPYNPWPAAGEIDIMEYVSRLPNEIFGTIHGPGYSGGGSFGDIYDFGSRVDQEFHTFTVEWEPNLITWYVDGIQYHQAEPSDVPGPWVFEKPFFLLLNFAIGGNFGGDVDPANVYPQEYLVDYVRVYQGPDTAERFETTFTDSVDGWQQVSIPIADFVRSAHQPAGAPDDGLTLSDVWGYGFELPYPASGTYLIDQVRRTPIPPPTELVVTTAADSGAGSLREALELIADGGTITFDPALAGSTVALTSGQLSIERSVIIDGSGAPGLVISGSNSSRVLAVGAGVDATITDLDIADGVAAPQGGGVYNLGNLTLDRVVVRDNTMSAPAPANFEFGGGGIYNGDGARLTMTDSAVRDNTSVNQPGGGIYAFFNATVDLTRTTVGGNTSGDVAGGIRSLGDATIVDSTISDNRSAVFHGGGLWATDGTVNVTGSSIVGNSVADGTAGGIMVATFGAPVLVTIADSVIDNALPNCQIEGDPSVAVLTLLGGNTISDSSCAPPP